MKFDSYLSYNRQEKMLRSSDLALVFYKRRLNFEPSWYGGHIHYADYIFKL